MGGVSDDDEDDDDEISLVPPHSDARTHTGSGYIHQERVFTFRNVVESYVPGAPASPTIMHIDHKSVTIAWSPPSHVVGSEPLYYVVEMANGPSSTNFFEVYRCEATVLQHTKTELEERTTYRFRISATSRRSDRGPASLPTTATTTATPTNVWLATTPRAHRMASSAGGRDLSDGPRGDVDDLPSPRRGHSMVALGGFGYLFGGFTSGYHCDPGIGGEHRLGMAEYESRSTSGKPTINRCRRRAGVSNDLWRLDPVTNGWAQLKVVGGTAPAGREMHSAVVMGKSWRENYGGRVPEGGDSFHAGNMIVFGGHSGGTDGSFHSTFPSAQTSESGVSRTPKGDTLFHDVWELFPGKRRELSFDGGGNGTVVVGM